MEEGGGGGDSGGGIAGLLLLLGTPTAILGAVFAGFVLSLCWRPTPTNRDTQQESETSTSNNTDSATASGPRRRMSQQRNSARERECPICLDAPQYAVETNCGHMYCANCFIQNWQRNFSTSPVSCPFCRQQVTLLIPCLTENEQNTTEAEEVRERDQIMSEVGQYNRMYSPLPRSYYSQLQDLPMLLRHLWRELFTWRGLEMLSRARIMLFLLVGVIYTICPIDLIPEAFVGIVGIFDDLVVGIVIMFKMVEVYRTIVASRDW